MSAPSLLLCSEGRLGEYGRTFKDFDVEYSLRARVPEIAPAGAGGACRFPSTYLTISFNVPFQVRVTPILDGIEYWDESVDIVVGAAPEDGQVQTHVWEIAWNFVHTSEAGREISYALMGRWFQVEIWMPCPVAEEGIVDLVRVEHEYEVLSESGAPQ